MYTTQMGSFEKGCCTICSRLSIKKKAAAKSLRNKREFPK